MINAQRGIVTLEDLRDHLQYAIGLELTTIPVPFIDELPVIRLRAFSPAAIDEFIALERSARPRCSGGDAGRERAASSPPRTTAAPAR
jgi:hypothetical protein